LESSSKSLAYIEQATSNNQNFARRFFHSYNWQILIFFVLFIPLGAFTFFIQGYIHPSASMELISMVGSALLAGLDWSAVIAGYFYTGFGSTLPLFPLFLFNLSPYDILVGMGLFNTALLAFCGVIAYNIMTGIFEIECKKITVFTSIAAACLYMNLWHSNMINNHTMMVFLDWSVLYLMLTMVKRLELGKSNILQSFLLSFLMCYGFLVHTRILFLWGAAIVFFIAYLICRKKLIINIWAFLPSFAVLFFLANIFVNYVQTTVYLVAAEEGLQNDVAWIGRVLTHFDYSLYLHTIFIAFSSMIVAQVNNIITLSSGMVVIPVVALVLCFVCLIWKKTRLHTQLIIRENTPLFLATMYTAAHIAAIVLLMAWGYVPGIQATRTDVIAFVMNYWAVALAPIVVLSVAILYKMEISLINKLLAISVVTIFSVGILFAYIVAPQIHAGAFMRPGPEWTVYSPLTFWSWVFGEAFEPTSANFLLMTVIAGSITLVLFLLVYKQKLHIAPMLLLAFFLYSYSFMTIRYHVPMSQSLAGEYLHIQNLFNNSEIDDEDFPLYAYGSRRSLTNLQFNLYRHSVVPITREPGFPHFIDTSEVSMYITNNVGVDSVSWNMFFGSEHKLVDFSGFYDKINAENTVPFSNHQLLINSADTALVAQIEFAGYTLLPYDTIALDPDSLGMHSIVIENEASFFLAPRNISHHVILPAGEYELTLYGADLLGKSVNFPEMPDGMTITNNSLTYSFTFDYSRTLSNFFSTDIGWGVVDYLVSNNIWFINQLDDMTLRLTERFSLHQTATYELGSAVYFDETNANYHAHVLGGLSVQEKSGVWTLGNVSEFVFFLPDTADGERLQGDLTFSFTVEPLVSSSTTSIIDYDNPYEKLYMQKVEIAVNGELLDVMNIIRRGTYEVRIPSELITDDNRLHIVFRFPTATSPAALGIDIDDDRVLALFLEEMKITSAAEEYLTLN